MQTQYGVNCPSTVGGLAPEGQYGLDIEDSGMVSNVVVTSGGVFIPSTSTQDVVCQVHPVPPPFQGDTV